MVGLGIALFVCIWAAVWAGILRELNNAPQIDEFGNIIKKKDDE